MATEYRTQGIKSVHHSDTGALGSWTAIAGKIDSDNTSDIQPEAIKQDYTFGAYQSGESGNPKFAFLDFNDHLAVKAFARPPQDKYWAIVMADGTIYKTKDAWPPIVTLILSSKREDADAAWMVELDGEGDDFWEKIASLT